MTDHICRDCGHRDGDWCQFTVSLQCRTPPHLTWWPINWDEAPDCNVPSSDDDDEDEECSAAAEI